MSDTTTTPGRLRIPCAAPKPFTDAERATVADRMGCVDVDELADLEAMYTRSLGPGALVLCPSCKGGDLEAEFPEFGCAKCIGRGYQWAIEGGDGQGGWAVIDWSDAGETGPRR